MNPLAVDGIASAHAALTVRLEAETSFYLVKFYLFDSPFVAFVSGARLPLYACKNLDKSSEKLVINNEDKEPPVAFLESLVLGEVNHRHT